MKKLIIILTMACLLMIAVMPVSAETYQGTIESPVTGTYNNYAGSWSGIGVSANMHNLTIGNIQSSSGLKSWILFPRNAPGSVNSLSFTGLCGPIGTNNSAQTSFEAYIGNTHVGSGDIGFQRTFTYTGTETNGYIWVVFNSWSGDSFTGAKLLNLTWDDCALHGLDYGDYGWAGSLPSATYINNGADAINTISTDSPFYHHYNLTGPAGVGIIGSISKNDTTNYYSSKVFLINTTSGSILASEGSLNNGELLINIPFTSSLDLDVINSNGNWFNRTFTFTLPSAPTPTPTPATPGTNTTPIHDIPIPAGHVRTEATCNNGDTGGVINGCDISIYDIQGGVWNNVTGRYDGTWYIDTLPSHTLNMHSYYSGYSEGYEFGVPTSTGTIITTYRLTMWPSTIAAPGAGYLYLKVVVADLDTKEYLEGATVSIRDSTGLTQVDTVPYTGNVEFEVPNSSLVYVSASKNGYVTTSKTYTMSAFGLVQDVVRIEMSKKYVTATQTPVANQTTVDPAGTPDPSGGSSAYSAAKGQNMMDYLASNGMDIVQLCVLVTMLALLGIRLGK